MYVASLLHGEQHASQKMMQELMEKQDKLYPFYMKKYINRTVHECLLCSLKPTNTQKIDRQFKI